MNDKKAFKARCPAPEKVKMDFIVLCKEAIARINIINLGVMLMKVCNSVHMHSSEENWEMEHDNENSSFEVIDPSLDHVSTEYDVG